MIVSLISDGDSDNLDNCNAVQQLKLLKKFFDKEVPSKYSNEKSDTELYQLFREQLKMNK